LIDAGFSAKRIGELLGNVGKEMGDIVGIFLTHEHSDHAEGLRGISRKWDIPCFANAPTAKAVQSRLGKEANWKIFETGKCFQHKDLQVQTFAIPHDAYEPVGFVIKIGNESLAWATDLGYVSPMVAEHVCEVDVLVIEANHDIALLQQDTKRPWSVKQRVLGRHGHLSNDATFAFIEKTPHASWKKIYLAHLSQDCNDVRIVDKLFEPIRQRGLDVKVVDPKG
jgi:phosphoribosyl 1,2-cyclic phosphodiesterase